MAEPSKPDFAILGLDHVVLLVRDPEATLRFYCEVLGCTLEKRQEAIGLTQLRAGRSLIDLLEPRNAPNHTAATVGRNVDHICLRIEPFDAAALADHLSAHGIAHGVVAERNGADGYGPSIYVVDPEGNIVELKGPPAA